MRTSRTWRRLCGGVLAAAVLALGGCANAEPGVVAYVRGDRITERQLDQTVGGLANTLQEGQRVNRDAVVNAMIQGAIAAQIATDRNIRVTDAERNELLRTSELAGLLDEPDAKALAYDFADTNLVAKAVGAQAYLDAVKATPVTLNPRFGVLNPEDKTITSVEQTGSLSTPAAVPVEQP
jgi:hypothetical protein